MRGSHREKDKEKNRFWLKVLWKFWAQVSYRVSLSVAHLVLATCPQLVRQPAQNVCKAYQSGNSFCFALCYCSSLLSLSISYCRFIKISRIIADTKALYTSHSSHFLCQLFLFHEGGHANLARRETFTHVESANKKIDFETIWSDIAWRFYSHCGPFGILSEYFLVFSESISIRRAFFWFARYGKLFSFDMPQLRIVSFDTFLLFFMHSVNFYS